MKRRILTTLLTMCMVLMLLRIPAYAGKAYCDICGKWVRTTETYEYQRRWISLASRLLHRMWH